MSTFIATGSLIFVQVFSRLSTFAINQAVLRYLSPALLGASTQLELFSITILTFARDSLRVALAREGQTPVLQSVINAAHLPLLLSVPLALVLKLLYEQAGLPAVTGISQAVNWTAVAAIVEVLAEPSFALASATGHYGIRASAETGATIARGIATFAAVLYADAYGLDFGVLPFAYGQMAFAVFILLAYLWRVIPLARQKQLSLLPHRTPQTVSRESPHLAGLFSVPLLRLAGTLSAQTIVKQLLGEGDHVIMAAFATLEDQGAYELAGNYGSLIARMGLQPIEEGSRGAFSRLCAGIDPDTAEKRQSGQSTADRAAGTPTVQRTAKQRSNIAQARTILTITLRLYSVFSLICAAVGPTLAPLLLRLIAGAKWSDSSSSQSSSSAAVVLSCYCYLLPFLAYNGILEAFVAAVASEGQLRNQSFVMGIFTVGFAAASVVFLYVLELGGPGLVFASCTAMGLRIVWSYRFSQSWFTNRGQALNLRDFLPNSVSIAVAAVAASAVRQDFHVEALAHTVRYLPVAISSRINVELFEQLVIKGSIAGVMGVALVVSERDFWIQQYRAIQQIAGGGGSAETQEKKSE